MIEPISLNTKLHTINMIVQSLPLNERLQYILDLNQGFTDKERFLIDDRDYNIYSLVEYEGTLWSSMPLRFKIKGMMWNPTGFGMYNMEKALLSLPKNTQLPTKWDMHFFHRRLVDKCLTGYGFEQDNNIQCTYFNSIKFEIWTKTQSNTHVNLNYTIGRNIRTNKSFVDKMIRENYYHPVLFKLNS